jgi:hypothetical protein
MAASFGDAAISVSACRNVLQFIAAYHEMSDLG